MKFTKLIRRLVPSVSLSDRIRSIFEAGGRREYTPSSHHPEGQPCPSRGRAAALSELTEKHEIEKVLRVESPTNAGGIGDFNSAQEIPGGLHFRADRIFRVRPENIQDSIPPKGSSVKGKRRGELRAEVNRIVAQKNKFPPDEQLRFIKSEIAKIKDDEDRDLCETLIFGVTDAMEEFEIMASQEERRETRLFYAGLVLLGLGVVSLFFSRETAP